MLTRLLRVCAIVQIAHLLAVGPAVAADPDPADTYVKDGVWHGGFSQGWRKAWGIRDRGQWGLSNLEVRATPGERFPQVLRATYPAGAASPTVHRDTGAPLGGGQFHADLGQRGREALHLRYYVRFADDFDFVKGGKLPGLFGGTVHSGGHIPDGTNGFSTRFMWRRHGDGEVYAYMPSSKDHGTSLGRGKWRFRPGRWYLLEQELTLNAPDRADGRVRVWVDEKLVLDVTDLAFRTTAKLQIEGILFSTFFGGNDPTWATPHTTHAEFAAFAVGPKYIGP